MARTEIRNPFTRFSDGNVIFNDESGLALLLVNDVISHNSNWPMKDWPQECQDTHCFYVDCSHTFSDKRWDEDCVLLSPFDIQLLYEMWHVDKEYGVGVFAAIQRKKLPHSYICDKIRAKGIWDIDNMGLQEWQ